MPTCNSCEIVKTDSFICSTGNGKRKSAPNCSGKGTVKQRRRSEDSSLNLFAEVGAAELGGGAIASPSAVSAVSTGKARGVEVEHRGVEVGIYSRLGFFCPSYFC
jgi:hypothetical protein